MVHLGPIPGQPPPLSETAARSSDRRRSKAISVSSLLIESYIPAHVASGEVSDPAPLPPPSEIAPLSLPPLPPEPDTDADDEDNDDSEGSAFATRCSSTGEDIVPMIGRAILLPPSALGGGKVEFKDRSARDRQYVPDHFFVFQKIDRQKSHSVTSAV